MLDEDFLVAGGRGAAVDCEGLGEGGADGVCGVVDIVVLDVQDWPGLGAPGLEEVLDVFYEVGRGAGPPGRIAFHETMLQVDDEEDWGVFCFSCHDEGGDGGGDGDGVEEEVARMGFKYALMGGVTLPRTTPWITEQSRGQVLIDTNARSN